MILSICIPTYNRSDKIKSLLESLIMHRFHELNIEILVSNNGSTDQTEYVINEYKETFKIYNQSANIGFKENIRFLYSIAAGHYILLLGDDDEVLFDKLYLLIEFLEVNYNSLKPDLIILKYGIYFKDSTVVKYSHNVYLDQFHKEKNLNSFGDLSGNFYKPFVFLSGFLVKNSFSMFIEDINSNYYPQMDYALNFLNKESSFLVFKDPICNWIPPTESTYSDFRLDEKTNLLEEDKLNLRKKYLRKFGGSIFWDERIFFISLVKRLLQDRNLDSSEKIIIFAQQIKSKHFIFLFSIFILLPIVYIIKKRRYSND
jgi:glycosyltransferase involved in cell wall biosynthesis